MAHPDDEVLGCGGWIAHLIKTNNDVSVIFTTDGVRHPPVLTDSKEDAHEALQLLGVKKENIHFLNIKTQRSDEYVLRDYTGQIEKLTNNIDLVITPSRHDLNVDHAFAYNLALICFRPVKYRTKIVTMEILSSSEWSDKPFHANYYIDISDTIDLKIASLAKYTKQVLPFPHPRSSEAVRIKAQQRGLEVGYHYAEAYHIVRWF